MKINMFVPTLFASILLFLEGNIILQNGTEEQGLSEDIAEKVYH